MVKAQEMYPLVLNLLTGVVPLGGHDTVGVAARWRNCCLCTYCLIVSCSDSLGLHAQGADVGMLKGRADTVPGP